MCCEPIPASPEDTVGQCPACGCDVDKDGDTTEEWCFYSDVSCKACGIRPCDGSC